MKIKGLWTKQWALRNHRKHYHKSINPAFQLHCLNTYHKHHQCTYFEDMKARSPHPSTMWIAAWQIGWQWKYEGVYAIMLIEQCRPIRFLAFSMIDLQNESPGLAATWRRLVGAGCATGKKKTVESQNSVCAWKFVHSSNVG
jgi:hypothetical protein